MSPVTVDMDGLYIEFAFAFAMGALTGLFISFNRYRLKCPWCLRRHPKRDPRMTAEEFMRFYCDGWKAIIKAREAGEWGQ